MPANPLKTDQFMVRRSRKWGREIRELARRLGTTPSHMMAEAVDRLLPELRQEAEERET